MVHERVIKSGLKVFLTAGVYGGRANRFLDSLRLAFGFH